MLYYMHGADQSTSDWGGVLDPTPKPVTQVVTMPRPTGKLGPSGVKVTGYKAPGGSPKWPYFALAAMGLGFFILPNLGGSEYAPKRKKRRR